MFTAWQKFRRGKHRRQDVLNFERDLEKNIFELQAELKSSSYKHGSYEPFTVWDPKQRRIHKANVRDRLVHQALVSAIEPIFELGFIYDSFSCRKGKGTHAGVARLRHFLQKTSRNNSKTVYALKCDIFKFFASVEHTKLLDLLSVYIRDERATKLLAEIINSFSVAPGKGIPLGNLTSQLFANVYMHEFDWFVKHNLRQKYYVRYCDDFIIVDPNRQELLDLLPAIEQFLSQELKLTIHPDKIAVRSWNQGIDFLGYVLKPHCTLLRTKTKTRLLKKVNLANLSSYLGLCVHANSYELQQLAKIKAYENSNYYSVSGDV
ncbi:MAG: reverse transcriptase/maturase family protein [Candidatus Saccharimonadales bacterium]